MSTEQQRRFDLLIANEAGYDSVVRSAMAMTSEPSSGVLVLFSAVAEFSFRPRPSTILVPHMPPGVIACVPALEEFGVASRLASTLGLPGCFDGTVIELAELWLGALAPGELREVHITASGDDELLREVEQLKRRFSRS
ncbi:MAG: hypothetical protein ABW171_11835 [Steroidobacter sp.]